MFDDLTIEQARKKLLEYNDDLAAKQSEIDALTAEKAENVQLIEELRTLNQQLFLRAAQGNEEPTPEPAAPPSLEDCAKGLCIIIN